MRQMSPILIAGSASRPTLFSASVADSFGFHATLGASARMGQAPGQEVYDRARRKVAEYDALVSRLRRIANQAVREQLYGDYVGDPSDSESGSYRRDSVASDIAQAESYTPPNTYIFTQSRVASRVEKLDDWVDSLHPAIRNAEAQWDILPEPVVIERERLVQVPGAPQVPGWVVPVLGIGAAVGLAALLGVFK